MCFRHWRAVLDFEPTLLEIATSRCLALEYIMRVSNLAVQYVHKLKTGHHLYKNMKRIQCVLLDAKAIDEALQGKRTMTDGYTFLLVCLLLSFFGTKIRPYLKCRKTRCHPFVFWKLRSLFAFTLSCSQQPNFDLMSYYALKNLITVSWMTFIIPHLPWFLLAAKRPEWWCNQKKGNVEGSVSFCG